MMRLQRFFWVMVLCFAASLHAEKMSVGVHDGIIKMTIPRKDYTIGMEIFMREYTKSQGIDIAIINYDDPLKMTEDLDSVASLDARYRELTGKRKGQ